MLLKPGLSINHSIHVLSNIELPSSSEQEHEAHKQNVEVNEE